ncbi:MAG: sugar O-acetyltransferase, partial [Planctomycetota bacterium]
MPANQPEPTIQTELQKMLAGDLYRCSDPELRRMRQRARSLVREYNATSEDEVEHRQTILGRLFRHCGTDVEIEPPFRCDYGAFISIGDHTFLNFDCVILDCNQVTIGERCLIAPGVHMYAATHPTDPEIRRSGLENSAPITIGNNVWIGGRTVICPGVSIGDDVCIGAGSIVTRDIPSGMVALGNPCRVIRPVDQH